MTKFSYSFGVAIGIHIIALLIAGFLVQKKEDLNFNSRNLIDVQFGSGADNSGGSAPKKKTVKSSEKKTTPLEIKSTTINSNVNESGIGTGSGTESNTGAGSGLSSGNSFEASIVNYQGPLYPRIAQVRGLQGNVRLRIKVSEEGMPEDTTILQSSGHDVLDRAALEVIPRWRFQKKYAPYFVEKNIYFRLKD
ncbi:MAG: energy transducer TonB [Rhizobacter sp.]|nr:energy transducer TonB [Bacteriovorax sp.]